MLYIRIHRRIGNMRVLRDDEIGQWRQRILEAVTGKGFNFSGCIFVLYGTDYLDHPIQNAKKMAMALPEFQFNWRMEEHYLTTISRRKVPFISCCVFVAVCKFSLRL